MVRGLLSLVVPPLCAICREPEFGGLAVCERCRARLVPLAPPRCACCGAPVPLPAARCRECLRRSLAFSRAWAPFAYEGECRRLVAALKSHGAIAVAGFMAAEIAARSPPRLLEADAVAPVPAHRRRHRRHGFNQAEAIANSLSRATGLPTVRLLEREGAARPQVGLERQARLANARGSVRLRPCATVPRRVLLVDDVYTTGATLDACARALRRAGADRVAAATFARAVRE